MRCGERIEGEHPGCRVGKNLEDEKSVREKSVSKKEEKLLWSS